MTPTRKIHLLAGGNTGPVTNPPSGEWGSMRSLCGKMVDEYATSKEQFRRSKKRCGACMRSAAASWGWVQRVSTKLLRQDRKSALYWQRMLAPNAPFARTCKLIITGSKNDYLSDAFCEGCGFVAAASGVPAPKVRPVFEREHRARVERRTKATGETVR